MDLFLAGLHLDVAPRDEIVTRLIEERHRAWTSPRAGARDVRRWKLELETAPDPSLDHLAHLRDVELTRTGARLDLRRTDLHLTVDLAGRAATARFLPELTSLQSVLRAFSTVASIVDGGLLVHASSVAHRDRGHLFAGPSGAGKTTVVRASEPRWALSDEVSSIVEDGDRWALAATPFWGEYGPARERPAMVPLEAIHFLEQAKSCAVEPVTTAMAVRRLLQCVFLFGNDATLVERALTTASRVLAAVRRDVLRFTPDARLWDTIDGQDHGIRAAR